MSSLVPSFRYPSPSLGHRKLSPYIDFPLVYGETVTERAFYVDRAFTFVTSDPANTTLLKWTGIGWVSVTPIANPENINARGYFAVTTAADAYVAITEHIHQ